MTYATEANIISELKNITFDVTDPVTSADVATFLDQTDAIIDMHLNKRYTTPVTASEALLIVKKIAIDLVAYRVAKILNLTKSVPIPDQNIIQQVTEGSAYRESMKLLVAMRDGKMDLPGETEVSPAGGIESFHTETGNSGIVPCFNKGKEQW